MSRPRKVTVLLLAGAAFGVLVAGIKGQDTGMRDALGNTSAPWIVLPFVAGTLFSRARSAALAGLAVTLVSLLGFYVAEAVVLDLGPHPWWVDLRLTAGYVNVYERWGVVSGLLYGTLGWLWASRSKAAAAPLIVYLVSRTGMWYAMLLDYPWLWRGEVVLGLAAIALALTVRPPERTAT
jgi:hypothetical protein